MKQEKSLPDYEDEIEERLSNRGSYSRNIIGSILRQVDSKYGTGSANALVRKYKLTDCGFNEE